MRFYKMLLFIVIGIFIILLCTGCLYDYSFYATKAENGILDLTKWDMNKQSNIQLDGQWEFYWDRLLEENDFHKENPDLIVDVPNTWNKYSINGKSLPGQGYATYRLHVKTKLPKDTMLGLRIYNFSSSYKMFINDKQVASNGKVSTIAAQEVGDYKPKAALFNVPSENFDIIIQVSNFQYSRGGYWYTIFMGSADSIVDLHAFLLGKEAFLIGTLIILFLFYLNVYLFRRELKYSLYFALLCISMLFSFDMVGQFILLGFLPQISLKYVILFWYSSATWSLILIILFVHELFKSKFSEIVMKLYLAGAIFSQLIYIITPTTLYTGYAYLFDIIAVIGALCTIIIVAIGIKHGQKGGWLNIASMIIVAITYIHDNLYWINKISKGFGEYIYFGLFLFVFLQMVIQAQRIKQFDEHKTAAELSFLQAQIKPHFLFNTLNTIISISRYDVDRARELLLDFSNYLRRSFDFKDLGQFVPLKNEIELSKAYIEIEKARFEERMEVTFSLPENMDFIVPRLILQPIIENAVIHGILPKLEDGRIDISIVQEKKFLVFKVKDNGIGMDKIKQNCVFEQFGNGVGLSNIDSRLRKLYGKGLQIKSTLNSGTEITWYVKKT